MDKKEQIGGYYPAFISIKGRKCSVIGGGEVALRKVNMLLEQGADVKVISPDLCPGLKHLAGNGKIKILQRKYQAGDLQDTFMAFAATDDTDANREMVREAREKGVLVNVADQPDKCDFFVPSYLRRGDITIAISTGGNSPALARKIRTRLEKILGDEYAALASMISEVRSEVKQRGVKVDGSTWEEALDLDLLIELVRKGESQKAKNFLLNKLTGQ